jgi:SAM-dependent methyltransferase
VIHEDREKASSFGDDPQQYDRSRPSYPAALVDDLAQPDVHRVVDAGCGTGIASLLFVARGCHVVGVEADPRMAGVARSHGLTVEVSAFEDWEPPGEPFDLVIAAQAWHWIHPQRGAIKAAEVLRPGGRFAAFWNSYDYDVDVLDAIGAVYRDHAPHLQWDVLGPGAEEFGIAGIAETDAFSPIEIRTYDWEQVYGRDAWLDQLSTRSSHRTMDPARRAELLAALAAAIDRFGGQVTIDHSTRLCTAVRLD